MLLAWSQVRQLCESGPVQDLHVASHEAHVLEVVTYCPDAQPVRHWPPLQIGLIQEALHERQLFGLEYEH